MYEVIDRNQLTQRADKARVDCLLRANAQAVLLSVGCLVISLFTAQPLSPQASLSLFRYPQQQTPSTLADSNRGELNFCFGNHCDGAGWGGREQDDGFPGGENARPIAHTWVVPGTSLLHPRGALSSGWQAENTGFGEG